MKTLKQVDEARSVVVSKLLNPDLNDTQRSLLSGMLIALVWAADGPDCTTMDRLLSGEPVVAGKDPAEALKRLKSGLKFLPENRGGGD